jgi:hypothetical protein
MHAKAVPDRPVPPSEPISTCCPPPARRQASLIASKNVLLVDREPVVWPVHLPVRPYDLYVSPLLVQVSAQSGPASPWKGMTPREQSSALDGT